MENFAVYADWRMEAPISDDVLAVVNRAFGPSDESVCVWIDENDPAVLKLTADVQAAGYEEAGQECRRMVYEAATLAELAGQLVGVTACTEEGQAVWRHPEADLSGP